MTKILSQGCMLVKAFLNFEPFCDSSGHNQILQISQKSPCHAMHAEYAIPFGKNKSLSCVLSKPTSTPQHVGVILGHGAGGDMHSGNLPLIAETLAREGFLCIRFTCRPVRLSYRVKACQVLQWHVALLCCLCARAPQKWHVTCNANRSSTCQALLEDAATRADLAPVTAWVFAGHSMVY